MASNGSEERFMIIFPDIIADVGWDAIKNVICELVLHNFDSCVWEHRCESLLGFDDSNAERIPIFFVLGFHQRSAIARST
jgi:hypothetical protein